MPLTGFQVERVLERLRALRRRALGDGPPRTPTDPVRVSPEAEQRAEQAAPAPTPPSAHGQGLPVDVRDEAPRDPVVTYELERRAGSFMMPPYVPRPRPASIPRLPRGGVKGAPQDKGDAENAVPPDTAEGQG